MTIIHSSDLGWKAGQDISQEFAALAKTFKPGDVFVFDHMYEISGSKIQLPDNFTLAGGAPGAGIDVIDTAYNSTPTIFLGHNNTLIDLTVTHSNTPQTTLDSLKATMGIDYHNKITFVVDNKSDVKVINSYFEGNTSITFDVRQGDNLLIQGTEFNGGYYQVRLGADVDSPVFHNSLFQNSLGDGIKTLKGSDARHTSNATVSESVFLNNLRDGIDTTGGFKDSVISDSYFVGNGISGIDLKSGYKDQSDFSAGSSLNENILIINSEFIDNPSAVVATTINRFGLLDESNAKKWAVQSILIKDSIVENTSPNNGSSKMFLVKDSYDIHWDNVSLLGNVVETKTVSDYDIGLPQDINGTGLKTDAARSIKPDSYYESLAGPDWSTISYPADGVATPLTIEPVFEMDPISYEPTPEPEDVPEVVEPTPESEVIVDSSEPEPEPEPSDQNSDSPVVDANSGNFVSKFLDVFLAYTDTDKAVTQLGDGTQVNSSLTEGRPLTIYATSQTGAPTVGSVKIEVPGLKTKVENVAPYALFGDDNGDFLGNKTLADGTYTVKLTAYEDRNAKGKLLEEVTLDFSVGDFGFLVESAVVAPEPEVEPIIVVPTPEPETDLLRDGVSFSVDSQLFGISLVDTNTDEVVAKLFDGIKLSKDDLAGRQLSISAEATSDNSDIGSMRLQMDGKYNAMENVSPYALFGDVGGDFKNGVTFEDGPHFTTLTAYSGKKGTGSILDKVTVHFEIGDYESMLIDGMSAAVSSYSRTQDSGTAKISSDQSGVTLESSAWKSLTLFKEITEMTVMKFDYSSVAEGEIQGIGLSNGKGELESTFFQLGGTQELGIQDFNDYETGSGTNTYVIPIGEFFTGEFDQLVLVNDDDIGVGSSSVFNNFSFYEAVA